MTCPHCNLKNTSVVIDARMTVNLSGERKRRRRECRLCGGRFTTYEFVDLNPHRHIPLIPPGIGGRKRGSKNKRVSQSNWLTKVAQYLAQ